MTEEMLVGVDWGGTKIEVVALALDGTEHFRTREDTPRGGVETWVAGRAFQAQYEAAAGGRLYGSEIVALARAGDRLASELFDRYIDRVARGLAVVVSTLDPDIFVFGRGISGVDERYERLPAEILQYTFASAFIEPIVRSVHGDSSGVRGAAWLWAEDR